MSIKKILIIGIILSLLTIGVASASSYMDTAKLIEQNGYTNVTGPDDVIQNYTKGSDYVIFSYLASGNLTLDNLQGGFEEKTINNTVGFYKENETGYYFNYNTADGAMLIRTTDGNLIEKIVVGNN